MLYVVTLGGDVKLSSSDLKQVIFEEKNLWSKNYEFRDMNLFDFKNKEYFYESRYHQHIVERNLIEEEYSKKEIRNEDYIVFTTDPIVFCICRFLLKKYQKNGKLIVYNRYNYDLKRYKYNEYNIDEDGRLECWPLEIDDMGSPIDILLSELL